MEIPWKRAIVIGASSGIGEAIARKLTAGGCRVALVARRLDRLEQIASEINGISLDIARPYAHDVTQFDQAEDLFLQIVRDIEGVDLVVYAAGIMPAIGPTEYDTTKDKAILDTNLMGAIAWLNAAAKRFERAMGGTILGISSVAGDRGRRGNPAYSAGKAGLDCYLESLRNRLSGNNVSVVTAKPGPVQTDMTASLGKLPGMIPCDTAATLILSGARKFGKTVYVPWKWWLVSRILRAIPSAVFRRMRI
jgi:decaprenylphospho-beta-D-erythro-pentofuranosid-2-ulose 2-reductase